MLSIRAAEDDGRLGGRSVNTLAVSVGKEGSTQMKAGYTRRHADGIWLYELSGRVIGCAFNVIDTLGAGFLERVYENALAHGLRKTGRKSSGWPTD